MFIQTLIFSISLILTLFFFLYGFNHLFLLRAARNYSTEKEEADADSRPAVAVHLPIYNEKYVVPRLIAACSHMAEAYGTDRVRIVLLDDSDDETAEEIDRAASEYCSRGYRIEVARRQNREGFKAGALKIALERTPEEFVAIFDADFIPPEDFLLRTIPHLLQNEKLGIIQCRWTHLNRDFNLLTRTIAIGIDVHFLVEQTARCAAGLFQNFNGSAGVLRRKAILEAGGWQADTLAEDLDLSYRMQLLGYRVLYLRDLQIPGELPPTVSSLKKQQGRWACGSLRTARKVLPKLLERKDLGFTKRLQAFIHLTGYIIHPLMSISFLLTCAGVFLTAGIVSGSQTDPALIKPQTVNMAGTFSIHTLQNTTWAILMPLILLCTISPWLSSVFTLHFQKISILRNLSSLLVLLLMGLGISLSNTIEAAKALLSNRNWEFQRTPKYAQLTQRNGWQARNYQVALDGTWLLEILFACLGIFTIWFALRAQNYSALLILIPFSIAYAGTGFLTVLQSRRKKI